MKKHTDLPSVQQRFSELVQHYQSEQKADKHSLDALENDIRALREHGATYHKITQMLHSAGMQVCMGTVTRFCNSRKIRPTKKKPTRKTKQPRDENLTNIPKALIETHIDNEPSSPFAIIQPDTSFSREVTF